MTSPAIADDEYCRLTIDLGAIAENWRRLAARAAPAECGAAVKADAYGCGLEAVVPALHSAGCRTFFVAHVSEGRRCRAALDAGRQSARIFVLNGFHPEAAPFEMHLAADLQPVLNSIEELDAWTDALADACHPEQPRAALHVDTGMNRLGLPVEEALALASERLAEANVDLVMSHFVGSEVADSPLNATQMAAFAKLRRGALGAPPASLGNSSALFLPQQPTHDLVRPGYALYGGNPTPGAPNPMLPVVDLQAHILQVRDVPAGATAGYNARWIAPRPSRLATLPIGYADGLPMGASGLGEDGAPVFVGDRPCPIVGRISMDLTVIDVTDAPQARPGTKVEILGRRVSVDEFAARAGTIGYQVLTSLGRRHRRHYI